MIKMLAVDDETEICGYIKDFFEKRGHKVFTAVNSKDALSILEKDMPRIVFLDIIMPDINGLELLKKIREKDKQVKVIMVSMAGDPSNIEEAYKLGADGFISKPFSTDYLEEVVMKKIQELVK